MIKVESFKPERDFCVDGEMTLTKIRRKYEENEAITGRVHGFSLKDRIVLVSLENGIKGILPFDEVSIEQLKQPKGLPAQVKSIARKKTIRVKIIGIEGSNIYVSRKTNLLDVFNKLENLGTAFYNATIENASKYNVFCDIGEGVTAYCGIEELTRVFIDDARNWVKIGNHVRVRTTKFNNLESLVWCSVKKASMGNYKKIKPKTKLMAKVGQSITDENGTITGYFVEITPAIAGIADISEKYPLEKLPKQGEMVRCYVRSVDCEKHRIKLYIEK